MHARSFIMFQHNKRVCRKPNHPPQITTCVQYYMVYRVWSAVEVFQQKSRLKPQFESLVSKDRYKGLVHFGLMVEHANHQIMAHYKGFAKELKLPNGQAAWHSAFQTNRQHYSNSNFINNSGFIGVCIAVACRRKFLKAKSLGIHKKRVTVQNARYTPSKTGDIQPAINTN